MTNQEIIEQLKSLKSHCEDFRNDEYCVWSKDVEALEKAIEALEKAGRCCANCKHLESEFYGGDYAECALYDFEVFEDMLCSKWSNED